MVLKKGSTSRPTSYKSKTLEEWLNAQIYKLIPPEKPIVLMIPNHVTMGLEGNEPLAWLVNKKWLT